MLKYSVIALALFAGNAFAAVNLTECEKIGYERGTYNTSICESADSCNERFAGMTDDLKRCLERVKTPADCDKDVAKRNAEVEDNNLLYRCPATTDLTSQKNNEKIHANHNLVYNDGNIVNITDLVTDTQNVYVFKATAGMSGFFGGGDKYYVIGPADNEGLFMSLFSE